MLDFVRHQHYDYLLYLDTDAVVHSVGFEFPQLFHKAMDKHMIYSGGLEENHERFNAGTDGTPFLHEDSGCECLRRHAYQYQH